MAERTLIKGGTVLSLDPATGNFDKADVLIEGSKIVEVGRDLSSKDASEIEAGDMIVMPGFVDTHRHMWQGLMRNSGTSSLLKPPGSPNGSAANGYRPSDIFAGTYSSALGALDAGITTILNYSNIHMSAEHTQADLDAVKRSGLRIVFATSPGEDADAFRAFVKSSFDSDLVTAALASAGPEFMSADELRSEWALARELGLRITTEVGMGGAGKAESLAQAAKAGLLSAGVLYAHCNNLSDANLRLLREHNGEFSLAPAAEMMLGYGQPTIQRMLDLNLRPSLGVDSEHVSRGDLFTQMRASISMQHAMSFEKKLAGRLFANKMMTTRDVIELATVQGAQALGMADKIGTLTPGKEADIILLRQNQINVMPVNDPIGAVVWAMDTSNVDTVLVAGQTLKRGGQLLNVDYAELQALTSAAREHVLGAVPA